MNAREPLLPQRQHCSLTMVARLLHLSPNKIPVELLSLLEPYREERATARTRYRDCPELRQLLCSLLEERSRHPHHLVRNALQNWRELTRLVQSGEFFREVFSR